MVPELRPRPRPHLRVAAAVLALSAILPFTAAAADPSVRGFSIGMTCKQAWVVARALEKSDEMRASPAVDRREGDAPQDPCLPQPELGVPMLVVSKSLRNDQGLSPFKDVIWVSFSSPQARITRVASNTIWHHMAGFPAPDHDAIFANLHERFGPPASTFQWEERATVFGRTNNYARLGLLFQPDLRPLVPATLASTSQFWKLAKSQPGISLAAIFSLGDNGENGFTALDVTLELHEPPAKPPSSIRF